MLRTAIQLFTLKDVDESTPELIARVGETEFEGVEFYDAHFDEFYDGAVSRTRDALEDAGLAVAGAHVDIDRLETELDDLVGHCLAVGCSTLVVPTYEPEAFATVEGIESAADRIGDAAAELAEYDIDLLYHNHTFEFADVDGRVAFERFVDRADGRFGFEPDVGLAKHAGYDPLALLEAVDGQAPVVHLTDSIPSDPAALHADVGKGAVNIEACTSATAAAGTEWFVCENGRTDDGLKSLEYGSAVFADVRDRVVDSS
ncbi:sugar phosphate isomerase/epimerase family protein [Natronorubrum halophilum]|uniref:sugar phosphate isomerase/epimerase family protein n=1 Tax=Natronorubrum halophilum TaxID=1702106 RepID=UPI000EF6D543|nr:TIM barrel protein [Natronorubrum halophilum]